MAPLIEQHREAIIALCKRYGITRLDVFGSAARGDDFDPATSDADFFYEVDESRPTWVDDWLDFVGELQQLLGRRIDLVDEAMAAGRPIFLELTNRDRRTVYAA